LGNY
jgi:hypothetical protein